MKKKKRKRKRGKKKKKKKKKDRNYSCKIYCPHLLRSACGHN